MRKKDVFSCNPALLVTAKPQDIFDLTARLPLSLQYLLGCNYDF
jgi:hypothetical protein